MIAIPTYKRSSNVKTLEYLKKENVPPESITMFVVDSEFDLYSKSYPEYNIVVGELGIANQRNFITRFYDEGTYVISMDDDIHDLISTQNLSFLEWVSKCIEYMKSNKIGLLGISPVSNLRWIQERNDDFKCGRYLCVGVFQIYQVRKECILRHNYIEDYERSIFYLKQDGAVGRYNGVCLKTKFWGNGGCMASGRTVEEYCSQVHQLVATYPEEIYIAMKQTPLSNEPVPNIRIRRTAGQPTPRQIIKWGVAGGGTPLV